MTSEGSGAPIRVCVPLGTGDRPLPALPETARARSGLDRAAAGAIPFVLCATSFREVTRREFEAEGWTLFSRKGPRGLRLREAAAEGRESTLCFLHADTLLPAGWARSILEARGCGARWGAFRHRLEGGHYRWISFGANLRSLRLSMPLGDQAPFVERSLYFEVGGHPDWSLFDDFELSRRLKARSRARILKERVETSARRYRRLGPLRTVLLNQWLRLRFRFGASPETLARRYRDGAPARSRRNDETDS